MSKDPLTLVPLLSARTEFEASAIAEALRARGFEAVVHGTSAVMLQAYTATASPVRVMIPRHQREAAEASLAEIREEAKSINWADVMENQDILETGEAFCENCGYDLAGLPAGTVCPECGERDEEP